LRSYKPKLEKNQARNNKAYSRGIAILKAFAPAKLRNWTPSLILAMIIVKVEALFWKKWALFSFQISYDISIARDAMAFFDCPCLCMTSLHQSLTLRHTCQLVGSRLEGQANS
jgi:hypothetical protein